MFYLDGWNEERTSVSLSEEIKNIHERKKFFQEQVFCLEKVKNAK